MPNNGATNGKKNNGTNNTKPNNANNDEYKRNIEESKKLLGEIENLLRQKGNNSSGSGEQGNGEQSNGGNPPGGGGKGNGGITPGSGGSTQKQSAPSIPSVGHSEIKPNAKQVPNIKQEELGQIVTPAVTPVSGKATTQNPTRPPDFKTSRSTVRRIRTNFNQQVTPPSGSSNSIIKKQKPEPPPLPSVPPPVPPPPSGNNLNVTPQVTKQKENNQTRTKFGPTMARTAGMTSAAPEPLQQSSNTGSKKEPTQKEIDAWQKANPGYLDKIFKEWAKVPIGKGEGEKLTADSSISQKFIKQKTIELMKKQKGGAKRRTRKRKSGKRTRKNRRTK